MRFKKGQSGNPSGRPKGAMKKPIHERLEVLLDKNFKLLERQLNQSTPEQKADIIVKIAAMVDQKSDTNRVSKLLSSLPVS